MSAIGYVYLVGAGPWDPGLLTVRGRELLQRADVVVQDYLVNPELVVGLRAIVEIIRVGDPGSRLEQAEINALLVDRASRGKVVVRLKGGDPFVFGRGGEEALVLAQAGVPFEVVPGVTAAIACASYAGIPITHRGHGATVAFCTGHEAGEKDGGAVDWAALARIHTVVFYMGARNLGRIALRLIEAGRDRETPVALVRWATRPDQQTRISTLGACADADLETQVEPPAIAIVGEVVNLRETIGWYEQRLLHGLRVVLTRSAAQQGPLSERLKELGAEVLQVPTVAFVPPKDWAAVDQALASVSTYDWVIFTSANGVDATFDRLRQLGRDPRAFGSARIGCVGPVTARRLDERGMVADCVPETFIAEGLADCLNGALKHEGVKGRRYLILRAEVARDTLPDTLRALGGHVDVVPVYTTVAVPPEVGLSGRLKAADFDVVTFTASSTVRHFAEWFTAEELAFVQSRVQAVCIGPVTAATAAELGFVVAATAEIYTVPGLVDALISIRRA